MSVNVPMLPLLGGVGVLFGLIMVWRAGRRSAKAAAEAARAGARLVSLAGRVLLGGAVIFGVQWIVITHPDNTTLLLVVLALPDLFAAFVLTKALTVSTLDGPTRRSRGDRR
ncbi:hypothetical protein [Kutzneria albida]|uniref:Putative secreted protein n=1 Tax=Kutzneria albida DSM 43870 TaxID=1449976 RepID=W5VZS9_9PSEU|nr:hypothetical protein [Kutzneria albida]AHH94072.1 putative secreted protein [Kutzneria albida DSM 43870]